MLLFLSLLLDLLAFKQKGERSENWWNLIKNWAEDFFGFCTLLKLVLPSRLWPPAVGLTTIRGFDENGGDGFLGGFRWGRLGLKQFVQFIK
jgi:hypothetical protein